MQIYWVAQLGHKHQPLIILYIALVLSTRTCHAVVAKCNFPTLPWLDMSYPLYSHQSVVSRNLYGIATVSWCSLPLFCNKEYCHLSKLTATAHRVPHQQSLKVTMLPKQQYGYGVSSSLIHLRNHCHRHWHQFSRHSTRYTPHHVNTLTFPWTGTPLMERNKLWCLLPHIYS